MPQSQKPTQRRGGHGPNPGGPMMGKAPEHAQHFFKTIKRLFSYLSRWYGALLVVLGLAILATLFQIVSPKILGEATTLIYAGIKNGLSHGVYRLDFAGIGKILLIVAGLYVVSALAAAGQQLLMARVAQKIVYQMRRDLKAKLARLPLKYYDAQSKGDLMSRAINDMDNIAGTLQQNLAQLVSSTVTFCGVLVMMFTISLPLTLVAFVMIILTSIVIRIVAPLSQKLFAKQQAVLGRLNAQVEESYTGHAVVRSFAQKTPLIERFKKDNHAYYKASWQAQFVSGMIMPLTNFTKNIGYIAVSILGALMVAAGSITLGNIQAFLTYVNNVSQPIQNLANLANTIQSTAASAERIFEVLDAEEMKDESVKAKPAIKTSAKVLFDHVVFGYTPNQLVITDFNLSVMPGQKVAIVGPTGAGKSTLINLLERFYEVDGGAIYVDGKDIRSFSRTQLRQKLGMVLQETWLENATIWENLKFGKPDASDEAVKRAADAAFVSEFVEKLPAGFATELDEGANNLSQGQQQLLTIARALLVEPEVLILDEATSSVDTRTEKKIQAAMDKLLENKTSFVVAHRLSTIQNADVILVLNHGQIVESGTHQELLDKNGFYARLYHAQFEQ